MNSAIYKAKNLFRKTYSEVALSAVGIVLELFSIADKSIKKELQGLEDSFSIILKINDGKKIILKKISNKLKLQKDKSDYADLVIYFKNYYSAFLIFSLRISFEKALAEHRISTKGDIAKAMILIRCFTKILSYIPIIRGKR